ncbi:glycoside hydrolase family 3 N-terminal domain-containing protein [Paracoccus aminophilus]|uniref:beta-N-acetylhexosaminidase n=1 Tax=Paracoccus aminophilus JCM 7686 TaxID=1367847 RepID=S5Y5C0_PARAH|nr:glycoside hydrolase family 3 N-terminal domain-containing protein [Paracoccus aminophilus]AGT10915.1 beta-N-acetylhexosaminidase [Paracoccus aminophilus JCM 7686]
MARLFRLVETLRKAARQTRQDPRVALQRGRRALKAGLGMARGMTAYPAAWFGLLRPRDALAQAVSELLIVGFYGANARSASARLLARQVARGQLGAVFFVTQNIGTRAELQGLLGLFRANGAAPLIAVDQEGGVVQRITPAHGAARLPAALTLAATLTPEAARDLYAQAGAELAALGFTVNLGPVLDVHEPDNPAIGRPKRAYGSDPAEIARFAEAFTAGFASAGILCAAKHFPGQGRARDDSHYGVADISARWSEAELAPYARLFASPHPPEMVMMGHLRHDGLAPDGRPATVSPEIVTGLLREKLGFTGVILTDDVDMDAVSHLMSREEAVVQALAAGNDLIMVKNLFRYDPLLPEHAVRWVRRAIARGVLSEAQILASAARVRALRARLRGGPEDPPPERAPDNRP